jgi:hypothetical protein
MDPLRREIEVTLSGDLGAESYKCSLWEPATPTHDPGSPFILDLGLTPDDLLR